MLYYWQWAAMLTWHGLLNSGLMTPFWPSEQEFQAEGMFSRLFIYLFFLSEVGRRFIQVQNDTEIPCKSNTIISDVVQQHYITDTWMENESCHRLRVLSILSHSDRCLNAEGRWTETQASWPVRTSLHTTNQTASALGTSPWVWIHVLLIHSYTWIEETPSVQ